MTDVLSPEESASNITGGDGHGLLTLPDGRSIPFKAHPLADLFPMMSADEHAALVDDVRVRGVRRPIVLLDNQVLDGRNRYMAARDAEVGYRVVEFTGGDPLAFVISENMRRRHLTEGQRAMIAAKIAKLPKGANQHTATAVSSPTQAQAAATMDVSIDSVQRAKQVIESGTPALAAAVESGQVSMKAAAAVARLPEAEQVEIIAQGPAAVKDAAKTARQAKAEPAPETAPLDPERKQIAKLTPEAMIDEIVGLRADLREAKDNAAALKAERDDLKSKLAEATSSDLGKALGNAQRRADTATGRMKEHMATAKKLEFRMKKAEARVAELEAMPVSMT